MLTGVMKFAKASGLLGIGAKIGISISLLLLGLSCDKTNPTANTQTVPVFAGTVTDTDGNVYLAVKIGNQVWMAENLKTTKYNDGSAIPLDTNNSTWSTLKTGAYCWYNNNLSYKNSYGALYNWYAVNTGKLAPAGWHVPTDSEWTVLSTYLGGDNVAGGKLKATGTTTWNSPNTGATNETGFSAFPCGWRIIGGFYNLGFFGEWWSATEDDANTAELRGLSYNVGDIHRACNASGGCSGASKGIGCSVRLLRDN